MGGHQCYDVQLQRHLMNPFSSYSLLRISVKIPHVKKSCENPAEISTLVNTGVDCFTWSRRFQVFGLF